MKTPIVLFALAMTLLQQESQAQTAPVPANCPDTWSTFGTLDQQAQLYKSPGKGVTNAIQLCVYKQKAEITEITSALCSKAQGRVLNSLATSQPKTCQLSSTVSQPSTKAQLQRILLIPMVPPKLMLANPANNGGLALSKDFRSYFVYPYNAAHSSAPGNLSLLQLNLSGIGASSLYAMVPSNERYQPPVDASKVVNPNRMLQDVCSYYPSPVGSGGGWFHLAGPFHQLTACDGSNQAKPDAANTYSKVSGITRDAGSARDFYKKSKGNKD